MGATQSVVPVVANKHYDSVMASIPDAAFAGATVAITGCSSGVGKEAALAAAERGAARIFMLNRASERASAAENAVRAKATASITVKTIACDLMSFASVRAAAKELVAVAGPDGVHVLLLNAGVMACDEQATADGYDVQMQTNHLSHFLLAHDCMPALEKAAQARGESRIVSQSSGARFGPPLKKKYMEKLGAPGSLGGNGASFLLNGANWQRYHQTKLANVVFTMALHDRLQAAHSKVRTILRATGCFTRAPHPARPIRATALIADRRVPRAGAQVKALVCEPGLAATDLQKTAMSNGGMRTWEARLLTGWYQSAQDGTLPALIACFEPSAQSGDFYAPRGGVRGPPVAVAKAGVFANPRSESSSADVPSRDMLWQASEAAVGEFRIVG
jgi:NAD(P)-dependent dehydrogenase (short-subunit alcohol dehydrogenase family)